MKKKYRIMVIGGGGREHAMVWSFVNESNVEKVFCAPGNGGTADIAENVSIPVNNFEEMLRFVHSHRIDFTIVGPEQPLSEGIVDYFRSENELIFGPTKEAARLESSKIFAREFMARNQIPQPGFIVCDSPETARTAQKSFGFPVVIKADGLAAGKGVIICKSESEFENALEQMFTRQVFGTAGDRVTIEEFLKGDELSVFAVCDGESYVILNTAQDHKRIYEGDEGPNTGGMGAYSPTDLATSELMNKIESAILIPTLSGLKNEGTPYTGFLYAGIMVVNGDPYVIEYNVRMGDPETQVVLPLIKSSFSDLIFEALHQRLDEYDLEISDETAVTVVLAAEGYPGKYQKGMRIFGLDEIVSNLVFHAGTVKGEDNGIYSSGGRVLNICGMGKDLKSAIENAYSGIEQVRFDCMIYRRDIGQRGLKYLLGK